MRKWLLILSALIIVALGIVVVRAFWPLPQVALVVSKEITYFTEPLNPDGTVDYVAAYNKHIGADADLAQNMAVPIIEALGPAALSEDLRDEAVAALRLRFSDGQRHFVRLTDHLDANSAEYERLIPPEGEQAAETERDRRMREMVEKAMGDLFRQRTPLEKLADSQVEQATTQPWSPDDLRIIADWVAANETVLNEISALERSTELVLPMVSPDNPPAVQLTPVLDVEVIREFRQSLACRAMLRLWQDDVAGAYDDALLMSYLGRLMTGIGSGGQSFNGLMLRADGARIVTLIAHQESLPSTQALQMLRRYEALPTAGSLVEADVLVMRLMSLDFIMQLARNQTSFQSMGTNITLPAAASFDLNDVMRRLNSVFDGIDAVGTHPEFHRRIELAPEVSASNMDLLSSLEEQVVLNGALDTVALFLSSSSTKRKFANDALVWVLLSLMMMDATATSADVQAAMNEEFARIALALAAYHADHGRYPDVLADLAPTYLTAIPKDLFNGENLLYDSDGNDYRVWSVGRNLLNDGGDDEDDFLLTTDE
jgi:hypothetical protein